MRYAKLLWMLSRSQYLQPSHLLQNDIVGIPQCLHHQKNQSLAMRQEKYPAQHLQQKIHSPSNQIFLSAGLSCGRPSSSSAASTFTSVLCSMEGGVEGHYLLLHGGWIRHHCPVESLETHH